jgi:hypothetical protein
MRVMGTLRIHCSSRAASSKSQPTDSNSGTGDRCSDDGIIRPGEKIHIRGGRSSALAPKRDLFWIATEGSYILRYPLGGHTLVLHCEVGAAIESSSVGKAEDIDTVVGSDNNVILRSMDPVRRKLCWDIDTSCVVTTTSPIEHYWQP